MSAYQAGKPRISSTVTKSNPRPRKYASASERQAAYRARAPEVCFRAEAKTVETLDSIAETLDQPRADLLLSMTKFALANHDWARFGLTHKPLPYGYGLAEQEFMGPRQANPQPIWKRTRPKSLGKPVPLTPKQKAAAKKRAAAAGRPYPNLVDNIAAARLENPTVKKPTPAQLAARARFAEMARSGAFKKKAASKRKKTVSQKISQLMHEGYPQKQAVAVALSEQRAGKVKATPRKRNPVLPSANFDYPLINDVKLFAVNDEMLYRQQGRPIVENLARKMVKGQFDAEKAVKLYGYLADSAVKKYSVDYVGSRTPTLTILSKPERQVLAQHLFEFYADEIKYAADEMAESKRKRNPATGQKGSRTKRNPVKRSYTVYCQAPTQSANSWTKLATFYSSTKATQYAKAYAKANPSHYVRVESHG